MIVSKIQHFLKILGISFLMVQSFSSYGQVEGTFIEDFDQDGIADELEIKYDGGSGFGGYYGQVKNGATGKLYELNTWGCSCDIKTIVPLPPEASLPEHKLFYEALAEKLFPDIQANPDPTLDWIIQANLKATIPGGDDHFDLILPVKLNWVEGEIQKPLKYQVKVDDLIIASAYHPIEEPASWINESKEGYLVYFGNNHELHLEQIKGEESALILSRGKHSLILKNEAVEEAVLFVTDKPLTNGPERLRDQSITGLISNGEFAIFTVSESPEPSYRIFLADLNSGTLARLREPLSGYGGKIFIEENNLMNQDGKIVLEDVSKVITGLLGKNL